MVGEGSSEGWGRHTNLCERCHMVRKGVCGTGDTSQECAVCIGEGTGGGDDVGLEGVHGDAQEVPCESGKAHTLVVWVRKNAWWYA